jgi:DNA-binding MarR family transcriptional regulator
MVVNREKQKAEDILAILGIGYLGLFLGQRMNEVIIAQSRRGGYPQMRESYGYVIQHLVGKDGRVARTGSELAHRMGVSQQAASKAVAELVRLGVVRIVPPAEGADRRAKLVQLTDIGWHGVTEARRARERLERQLEKKLGTARYVSIRAALRECLGLMGGLERIRNRKVRPAE